MNGRKKTVLKVLLIIFACVLVILIITPTLLKTYMKNGGQMEKTEKEDIPDTPDLPVALEEEPPMCFLVELKNEDIFEKGYYEYYFSVFTSGILYIGSDSDPETDIEWKVYVSDTELSEEEIYALDEEEPLAVNKGEIEVERGKWIYILCNINAKTSDEPSDSMFNIISYRDYA